MSLGIAGQVKAHYSGSSHGHVCTQRTGLNLRSKPSLSGRVYKQIPKGATVKNISSHYSYETGSTWYYVQHKNTYGWVSGNYICF